MKRLDFLAAYLSADKNTDSYLGKREPNHRKSLNYNCFILCVVCSLFIQYCILVSF